jgi:hypothetical protein
MKIKIFFLCYLLIKAASNRTTGRGIKTCKMGSATYETAAGYTLPYPMTNYNSLCLDVDNLYWKLDELLALSNELSNLSFDTKEWEIIIHVGVKEPIQDKLTFRDNLTNQKKPQKAHNKKYSQMVDEPVSPKLFFLEKVSIGSQILLGMGINTNNKRLSFHNINDLISYVKQIASAAYTEKLEKKLNKSMLNDFVKAVDDYLDKQLNELEPKHYVYVLNGVADLLNELILQGQSSTNYVHIEEIRKLVDEYELNIFSKTELEKDVINFSLKNLNRLHRVKGKYYYFLGLQGQNSPFLEKRFPLVDENTFLVKLGNSFKSKSLTIKAIESVRLMAILRMILADKKKDLRFFEADPDYSYEAVDLQKSVDAYIAHRKGNKINLTIRVINLLKTAKELFRKLLDGSKTKFIDYEPDNDRCSQGDSMMICPIK